MVVLWRLLERLKEYKAELDEVNTRMFFLSQIHKRRSFRKSQG